MCRRVPCFLFAGWLLTTAGCDLAGPPRIAVPHPPSSLRPAPPVLSELPDAGDDAPPAGRSVHGRAIRCYVHGAGGETVLVLGGIHGSEPAGAVLCEQLSAYLEAHRAALAGRRVVVAPATNPDGLAAGRRTNARGVDLNRNFDTRNRQAIRRHGPKPLSEPEARFIAELIDRYRPARIVTIHQPLACVDFDGPARELAAAMSRACGLPVRKLGARPGSLGSYAGVDKQIPIVTLELPKSASSLGPPALWRIYGEAMLVAIRYASPAEHRGR